METRHSRACQLPARALVTTAVRDRIAVAPAGSSSAQLQTRLGAICGMRQNDGAHERPRRARKFVQSVAMMCTATARLACSSALAGAP
jgi:hypothetical protein